jgi:hypothetical protein
MSYQQDVIQSEEIEVQKLPTGLSAPVCRFRMGFHQC